MIDGLQSLRGGEDPFNREAIWLQGYDQSNVRFTLPLFVATPTDTVFSLYFGLSSH